MKKYNNQDIISVEFILENCESVWIPQNCFKYFKLNETNDGYEMEAHIIDNGSLDGYLFDTKSPLQRLNCYSDICHINLKLANGEAINISPVWCPEDDQNNNFQSSKLISYKEIVISINKYEKELSIRDVLKLQHGTIVVDDEGCEYVVEEGRECKCLFNTDITDKILDSIFKIKKNY